ncbi:hypothetical protein KEJ19_00155 [Candidatus Bathyarchaeota archaeon]|nr:hypothetical protein [Candidatus Bathyarchaeota archaeon]
MIKNLDSSISIRQILAFAKRDFRDWRTYKTQVITQLITIVIGILSWAINAVYRNRPVPEYETGLHILFSSWLGYRQPFYADSPWIGKET